MEMDPTRLKSETVTSKEYSVQFAAVGVSMVITGIGSLFPKYRAAVHSPPISG